MSTYMKQSEFTKIVLDNAFNEQAILAALHDRGLTSYTTSTVRNKISSYRAKGILALASGNKVSFGEILKGSSTLHNADGKVVQQWIKTDVPKATMLDAFQQALIGLTETLPASPTVESPTSVLLDDLATLYISNDVHLGLLTWEPEVGADWNLEIGTQKLQQAYDYLFEASPASKVGIVLDLGDLTEADDFSNLTPHGKNPLDTDSRYPKVLRAAYQSLIYAVNKALEKHELVYFYNISGNHDVSSGHAVREVIIQVFRDNPRVIVDPSPSPIKYHQHGKTLLGFAHGDGLKMIRAGEVMAHDCQQIFSETEERFFHFGHFHVDSVRDSSICRSESHRNLPPTNAWAFHKGYRRGCGTMKSITYSNTLGEVARNTFNVK